MNRPVLWAALAFAGGIAAVALASMPKTSITIGALIIFLLYVTPHHLPHRDGFLIALVFFFAGATWSLIRAPEQRGDELAQHNRRHPETHYAFEATVIEAPIFTPSMEYMSVRLRVNSGAAGTAPIPLPGGVLLRWIRPTIALHPGEVIQLKGTLSPGLGECNIGVRGMEDYYRRHGYHSTLRTRGDTVTRLSSPSVNSRYWASRLRQWEAEMFEKTVPPDALPLIRAVWLGDRSALSSEEYAPYLKTGTAHILAVSGVHIGILYLTLQLILRGIIRNRKRRAMVILGCIMLFALVTGGRTPILRATIMLALYLWAEFLDREPDPPTALSLAGLLFLAYNPGLLFDTGFALSFTSLGSLLLFSQPIADRITTAPLFLRQNVGATLGVSILPLPLTAHTFHLLGWVGPLCNLLVIPLLTALLWLCLLTITFAPFSLEIASLFGHAAAPIVGSIRIIAEWGAAIPGGHRVVISPTWWAIIAYGIFTFGLFRCITGDIPKKRWFGIAGVAIVAVWLLWQPFIRPATLDFLDVGHGDAIFMRTPGGTTLLIDGGDKSDYVDHGERSVVPWLLAQGIDYLDYVVVSHPDRDHIGGIDAVLGQVSVGEVVLWPDPSKNKLAQNLVARCATLDIPIRRVGAGDSLEVSGATLSVLHPQRGTTMSKTNDASIVLHVQWPGISALLTGDIEIPAETLLSPNLPRVDVLKVPHHGSHTSSSVAFLDATDAQIAIVSTGRKANRQPVATVVQKRYLAREIPIYRTDHHGGVRVRLRKGLIHVETARGQRGYSLAPNDN